MLNSTRRALAEPEYAEDVRVMARTDRVTTEVMNHFLQEVKFLETISIRLEKTSFVWSTGDAILANSCNVLSMLVIDLQWISRVVWKPPDYEGIINCAIPLVKVLFI